jgi:DNA-binding transcriptional MocR family regulator
MSMKFASRMVEFQSSDIAEILKVIADPRITSFAGGLPAPELFPVEEMKQACIKALDTAGMKALQYSSTDGLPSLREKIASRMNSKFKTSITSDNILIVTGSQQALDLAGKLFLDEGDVVLCESPTYLGALDAFKAYRPKFVEVETDDYGMVPEDLEKKIQGERVRLIYVIPDFQNPTGKTWTVERRKAFMEVVNKYSVPVIEDNPYGELRFVGEVPPSLKSMDTAGNVMLFGTFSKILSPGLRIAWIAGNEDLLLKFAYLKQASDLHTSTISQYQIDAFMEMNDIDAHVEKLIEVYGSRAELMIKAIEDHLPEGVKFVKPEGGLFTWVEMPEGIDARAVLTRAIEKGVAFVPGDAFYPNGGHENTLRLNFSNTPPEKIKEGIRMLGEVMAEFF